jgi:hypothetical protein
MLSVDSVRGGIAPSPFAIVGRNVIRAIAGYAGQPVDMLRGGKACQGHALTESVGYTIAPPGHLPLRHTRFSLVEVPDLRELPKLWPTLQDVWMGAGPVPETLHRMLNALAWLVKWRVLGTLLPFSSVFFHAINLLRGESIEAECLSRSRESWLGKYQCIDLGTCWRRARMGLTSLAWRFKRSWHKRLVWHASDCWRTSGFARPGACRLRAAVRGANDPHRHSAT